MYKIFFLFIAIQFVNIRLLAQITITSSDINNQYTPGNTTFSYGTGFGSPPIMIDIGQLGATSWDFSFLSSYQQNENSITAVDPTSTPYYDSYFLDATLGSLNDTYGVQYQYYLVNDSWWFDLGFAENIPGTGEDAFKYIPPKPIAQFPYTYNSTIDYTGIEHFIDILQGDTIFSSNIVEHRIVDAYGPMTFPGGVVYNALRVKVDISGGFFQGMGYEFITKYGASVYIASDQTQPTTGVIECSYLSWSTPLVSRIEIGEHTISKYQLIQNYPNPFNPSTKIKYSIPQQSDIIIKVFDVLGNDIETLVNEEKPAGTYEITWNPKELPSGVYFYQLRADSFIETKKMVLMK